MSSAASRNPATTPVIVDAVRTPIGKRKGAYAEVHPADLSAHVLKSLASRNELDVELVEDVVWGTVMQYSEQAGNIARNAVLAAGWPTSIPGTTLTRACGSSQQALSFAAATVASGQQEFVVAGGAESMTRVPMGSNTGGDPNSQAILERFGVKGFSQGIGAEMVAERWGLSRTQLDEYSVRSHELSAKAIDAGAFDSQLAPLAGLEQDEGVRRGSSVEKLANLKTVFKEDGVIHAGNASQISDGAGALLVATEATAREHGFKSIARVHTVAVAADDPVIMLTAPWAATAKALKKSGLAIGDIGAFEVNEAFASVPLAWLKETGADPERMNPLGGAIAVGHPLGGSGAILMTRLVNHMRDNGIRYGLQTMCEAGGMANATIVELVD